MAFGMYGFFPFQTCFSCQHIFFTIDQCCKQVGNLLTLMCMHTRAYARARLTVRLQGNAVIFFLGEWLRLVESDFFLYLYYNEGALIFYGKK